MPDPEKLQGLWSASGVETTAERPAPPVAPRRIRFDAAPAPRPAAHPEPPAPAPALQKSAGVPSPPPPPAVRPPPALSPALAAAAALASAQQPGRPALGPPLPPRVPGPPAPAAAQAPQPPPPPARPAIPPLSDEALAAQIFSGAKGIDVRLQRLLEYSARTLSASSAFVADGDGLTVASLRSNEALAAITAPLGGVQEKISAFVPAPAEGGAMVELDEHGVLQLVWAGTGSGRLALGMVLPAPLDRGSTRKLRRLVQLAVDMKGNV